MDNKPEISKSQLIYGEVVHWIIIICCFISLTAPVLILIFPRSNFLNPTKLFNAIFEGKKSAEVWAAAGVPFKTGEFWKLFMGNFFTPDGFATLSVTLGCSVTLWALIPALWQFAKKKEYFYVGVSLFIITLIALAMSGIFNFN